MSCVDEFELLLCNKVKTFNGATQELGNVAMRNFTKANIEKKKKNFVQLLVPNS